MALRAGPNCGEEPKATNWAEKTIAAALTQQTALLFVSRRREIITVNSFSIRIQVCRRATLRPPSNSTANPKWCHETLA